MPTAPLRPSALAREKLRQVLVYFHPAVWSQMRYLRGICEFSRARRWCIRVVRAGHLLRDLENSGARFDGIFACTPHAADAARLRRLAPHGVGLDCPRRDWCDAFVDTDDHAIGEAAAAHFLERGFRNVAAVSTQLDLAYGERRKEAFRGYLERHDVPVQVFRHPERARWFVGDAVVRWLRRLRFPVAVFGVDDLVASHVLRACVVAGLRVPQEVAVLGADNIEEISLSSFPPLSTVDVPLEQVGFQAAEILHAQMEGHDPGPLRVLVPPTSVITRESTDALAVDDALLARAYAFLREHLAEGVGVQDLEKHLHAGRRQIERRAAEGWGCSPMEMIQRMRVAEAKQLLAHTDRTTDDIAQAAGFTGARALLKQFKRQVRQTPSAFRAGQQARWDRSPLPP